MIKGENLNPRDFIITLEYKNQKYSFIDKNTTYFMWEEGNYSCDCNKSLFIQRNCCPDFPEMECGDRITLVSMEDLKYERH